jgi:hypothetical protein
MMPIRLQKADLAFGQTDIEHMMGQGAVDDFLDPVRNEDAVTRPLRMWISPATAEKVALIARAHDVPSTVALGVLLEMGVRNWPGQFHLIEEEDYEPDPADLVTQFDQKGNA